jgi:cell division protein FtsX
VLTACRPYGCGGDGWQIQSGTGIIRAVSQETAPICKHKRDARSETNISLGGEKMTTALWIMISILMFWLGYKTGSISLVKAMLTELQKQTKESARLVVSELMTDEKFKKSFEQISQNVQEHLGVINAEINKHKGV